jgi:hypothetical protein
LGFIASPGRVRVLGAFFGAGRDAFFAAWTLDGGAGFLAGAAFFAPGAVFFGAALFLGATDRFAEVADPLREDVAEDCAFLVEGAPLFVVVAAFFTDTAFLVCAERF